MAAIYLIRHGQASFGKADYDQLSHKGMQQAEILGKHWVEFRIPDQLYSGELLRHRQTMEHFSNGLEVEDIQTFIHPGFNEFDHVDILTCYNKNWHNFANVSYKINELNDHNKTLQNELSLALKRWTSGCFDNQYKESWSQFKERCVQGLQDIIEQERAKNHQTNVKKVTSSKDILVFTSAGTISTIIQHILKLNDEQALQMKQQLRNTSVTKILFSDNKLSIDYINNYSHLELAGSDWVTFR